MSWFCQIRDPVHNFVGLNETETKIVNTPALQRLRGIKQLAMAHLVYPGAMHTRFDHTVGVCHVAGSLAESLDLTEEHKQLVRFAALLHDIGHGPFSHVSEQSLDKFSDKAALGDKAKMTDKIHEALTLSMIEHDDEVKYLISGERRDAVIALLTKGYDEPILRDIVSGPLDADKQDYLLRDSFFCGVRYGVFDLAQLHRSLMRGKDGDDTCVMVDRDGVHALEQFVMAKYYLTTQVVRHRVRLITDHMLARAIELGIEVDQIKELKDVYSYDGSPEFIRRYMEWDDARFLLTFGDSERFKGGLCLDMVQRLRQRRLFKRIYARDLNKKYFQKPETRDMLQSIGAAKKPESLVAKRAIEGKIAEAIREHWGDNIPDGHVILNVYSIKSVREQSRNDEKSILIDDSPAPITFEEKSVLFKSIDEQMNESYVEVYAPANYGTDTERRRKMNGIESKIDTIIDSAAIIAAPERAEGEVAQI